MQLADFSVKRGVFKAMFIDDIYQTSQSKHVDKFWFAVLFQLASGLHPQEVRPGIAVTTVTGTLVSKDNRYTLEPLDLTGDGFNKTKWVA